MGFDEEAVRRKIKALKAKAAETGPEAHNARRCIDALIKKYELDPRSALENVRTEYRVRVHRLKKYAYILASWCRVPWGTIRGAADYIWIRLDPDEYKLFYELYDELKHMFGKKEREFLKDVEARYPEYPKASKLKMKNNLLYSFMKGFCQSNYPIPPNICTQCFEGTVIELVCDSCGARFKGSSFRKQSLNGEAFNNGMATNTKSIRQNKIMIGHQA